MMGSGAAGAPGPEIENVWTVPVLATATTLTPCNGTDREWIFPLSKLGKTEGHFYSGLSAMEWLECLLW